MAMVTAELRKQAGPLANGFLHVAEKRHRLALVKGQQGPIRDVQLHEDGRLVIRTRNHIRWVIRIGFNGR